MSDLRLPFHRPEIDHEEIESVVEVLRSGWLTTGPKVREFEEAFRESVGARHAVAVNSCTAALHLALEAIGLRAGEEVIVPTMTFAATAEVVTYFGARPVLVDCNADDLNLDVEAFEAAITERTRAVIPVHFAGQPCDMDPILEIARRRGIRVIEDAAHAFPATYRGRRVGTLGDITCFSFYPTKPITTAEGGMATTERADWSERMRSMSLHGLSRDAWRRYEGRGAWSYEIAAPGFKYNLTDLAAALGIPQLRKSPAFWQRRRQLAELYTEALADVPGLVTPTERPEVEHAWHLFVVQVDSSGLGISRDALIEALADEGIGTSVHFIPLHLHPFYRDHYGYRPEALPNASRAFERIVSLPLFPGMGDSHVNFVADTIRKCGDRAGRAR